MPEFMKMLRRLLVNAMPGFMILFLAKPYVAGYCMDDAIREAKRLLEKRRILATIDVLGEDAENMQHIKMAKKLYMDLIDAIDNNFEKARPTVSIKPSSLVVAKETAKGLDVDEKLCRDNMEAIVKYAGGRNVDMTIDMEDHNWTDITLDLYEHLLKKGHKNVGAVLQSRLFRTEKDIRRFKDAKNGRFRICIGIYNEPPEIALQKKPLMKTEMFRHVNLLLLHGHYVEIATHDRKLLGYIFEDLIKARKMPPDRFEVQMLMGVPRKIIQNKMVSGSYLGYGKPVKVRLYVPFANTPGDAVAYCRRRLIANPDMMSQGAKSILWNICDFILRRFGFH